MKSKRLGQSGKLENVLDADVSDELVELTPTDCEGVTGGNDDCGGACGGCCAGCGYEGGANPMGSGSSWSGYDAMGNFTGHGGGAVSSGGEGGQA